MIPLASVEKMVGTVTCNTKRDKLRFYSQQKALRKKRRLEETFGRTYHVYQCPDCRDFHLTTKDQWA